MIRVSVVALLCALSVNALTAAEPPAYVVPVVTARVGDGIYSTTFALRNDGQQDVTCEAIYAVPNDPKGGTLRATYAVPRGGRPHVEEDVLMEVGAVGTMRLVCSSEVVIAARIQSSTDGGKTFDEGRTYAALNEAASFRRLRTLTAHSDLRVAEVEGKAVTFEAIVKNDAGAVIARKTYDVPAFAQQIVNLSRVREDVPTPRVELRVTSEGGGALVVGEETRDSALQKMAVRMTPESRGAFEVHQVRQVSAAQAAAASSSPSITEQLLISPFKAAPFREPATGLVLMRDRWYDPSTGTFLTPDPEGYGDSSNLYAFGKGDPVNNSDPTGRYIEERDILASPLRNRYIQWRDTFRSTPLGQQWWDAVHRSTTFTLNMRPMQRPFGNQGAVTTRFYDQAGNYTSAEISFSPLFGTTAPDNAQLYPFGTQVWNAHRWPVRRVPYNQYSLGHEFGHVLWGFDQSPLFSGFTGAPSQAQLAQGFNAFVTYQVQIARELRALAQLPAAQLTAQQQQRLAFLRTEDTRLRTQVGPHWQNLTERYGDTIGYEFYRSWLQQNQPQRFQGATPQLPPGITTPP